jgi:hypothetical protein
MRPIQLEFRPRGSGAVELRVLNHPDAPNYVVCTLLYPQQGQMFGDPPVDVKNAWLLNEAAEKLNSTLEGLAS